jgi:hypothetical protein
VIDSSSEVEMKHIRHAAVRILGRVRMGGLYTYWNIAN